MWVKLNPGIQRINLLSFYLLMFTVVTCIHFTHQFSIFLLKDPKYYGIPSSVLAEQLGTLSFYSSFITIGATPVIGIIFDTFGRTKTVVILIMLGSIATFTIPLFHDLYPWFFVTYVILGLMISTVHAPFIADYIQKDSMGLATSYSETSSHLGQLMASYVLLEISEYVQQLQYLYFAVAIFTFLAGCFLFFGLHDVIKPNKSTKKPKI